MKIKLAIALFLALTLTACKENVRPPDVETKDFVIIDPDKVPELDLKEVKVEVWNTKKMAEEATKPTNQDEVWFVFTREQMLNLFDNLTDISDSFAKSIESNLYYKKSIDEYRAKKKAEREAQEAADKKAKK